MDGNWCTCLRGEGPGTPPQAPVSAPPLGLYCKHEGRYRPVRASASEAKTPQARLEQRPGKYAWDPESETALGQSCRAPAETQGSACCVYAQLSLLVPCPTGHHILPAADQPRLRGPGGGAGGRGPQAHDAVAAAVRHAVLIPEGSPVRRPLQVHLATCSAALRLVPAAVGLCTRDAILVSPSLLAWALTGIISWLPESA